MSAPTQAARSAGDDNEVMAGVKVGSVDALGVLYDRYCDRAYRIARSVCGDDGRAQEAVQETFISIWATRENYEQQRGKVASDARDLQSLLADLPDAQREVITLAFYGQLTHTEIAEHLRLPTGTVKGRMRLGLQRLRDDIDRVAS